MKKNFLQLQEAIQALKKPVVEKTDFFDFQAKYRPSVNYEREYSFLRYPLEMIARGNNVTFCKGSQIGVTEAMLTYTLYSLLVCGKNVFYLLPTMDEASDFSASRFNAVVESNDELKNEFIYDNVSHKRCGRSNLYLRGSNAHSKLKSVPVSILIIDEYDEISPESIAIVQERLSGSIEKQVISVSTPTLPDFGIWERYQKLARYEFILSCLHCGKMQSLTIDSNLDKDKGTYFCRHCKKPWTQAEKIGMIAIASKRGDTHGWELQESSGNSREFGFHVSQLYSPTVTAKEISEKLQESDTEISKQAFYNHKLGLPYVAESSRLTGDILDRCIFPDVRMDIPQRTAGIDVSQSNLHYVVITCWYRDYGPTIEGVFRSSWEELPQKLKSLNVTGVVIDANPERHLARRLQESYGTGNVLLALYPNGLKEKYQIESQTGLIKIHRTEAIDCLFARFRGKTIAIRPEIAKNPEYEKLKQHCCNVVRQYREVKGQMESHYNAIGDDHYLHALSYATIAAECFLSGYYFQDRVVGTFI